MKIIENEKRKEEEKRIEEEKKKVEEERMKEEEKKNKRQEEENKIIELKVFTSIPIATLEAVVVTIFPTTSNEDDDQKGLMTSFRKLLEKNKSVKTVERTLAEVLKII